ncbi:MAG TPA: DNA polymerase III subunit gamma/tau [Ktedonobacterales bacterium]
MASQSLYRKWRSQTFSDLVGQEAVTRTLLNAVRDGRLAHAYLFCGPRGTGKTSAARLLAKAINCQNPHDGEPCNECVSCLEIATGRSPDVIEIDAASNNGVDDIRKIRENTNLVGSGGRYKVYVVDEVHMLSTPAFNALLKTLEEPPEHVIFVLATTEAHKVLATVVSRCQRFDFRRIRLVDIISRLKQVASGEGLTLEPAAADLLGRAAQGGLRDALSLLDQAVAFCGDHIDLERTRSMLGLADVGALRRLIACIAENRAADALDLLNELVTSGADLRQLNGQFAEEWRALMLVGAGADLTRVMDYTEEEARELASLAQQFSLDELMACARVFARNEGPARGLPVPQLALELALLECLSIRRRDVATEPTPIRRPPTEASLPQRATSAPVAPSPPAPAAPPQRPVASQSIQPEELDLAAIDAGTWDGPSRIREASPALTSAPARESAAPPTPITREPVSAPVQRPVAVSASDDDGRDWVDEAQRNWPLIRKICRQRPPMGAVAGGLLSAAEPVRYEPGSADLPGLLVIRTKFEVHLSKFRDPEMRSAVEWALEQALGVPMRAHFVSMNEPQRTPTPIRRTANTENGSHGGTVVQAASPQAPQMYERGASAVSPAASPMRQPQPSEPPASGRGEAHERPTARKSTSRAELEQTAREDPVVQELARMLKTEVADVRALDEQDGNGH